MTFILQIDNTTVIQTRSTSVLEACLQVKNITSFFCYHPALSLEGNCRMCLVEIDKMAKPQTACCLPVQNNMKIFTNSPLVKKAKENIMEFLLMNHPLDCPVCDQGNECDLQDHSIVFGSIKSRFHFKKKSVKNKYYGPLIKTIMNRCINCTRCVRFNTEILNMPSIGNLNRGKHAEIGIFTKYKISQNINSGNIIDICPVGALTSKPYAFKARSWELKQTPSLDIFDSIGSNITIESSKNEILRIVPRYNELINDFWINDRIRFCLDSFKTKRLLTPVYKSATKKIKKTYWRFSSKITNKFLNNFFNKKILINFESNLDLSTLITLKAIELNRNFRIKYSPLTRNLKTFSSMFLFNSFVKIKNADLYFLIGVNPKFEMNSLYLKMIKKTQLTQIKTFIYGFNSFLSLNSNHLGYNLNVLKNIFYGNTIFCKFLQESNLPLFLINSKFYTRIDSHNFFFILNILISRASFIDKNTALISSIHNSANQVSSLFLGFNPIKKFFNYQITYSLLNTIKNLPASKILFTQRPQNLYNISNTFLSFPSSIFVEKYSQYINSDGLLQKSIPCYKPLGDSRKDTKVLNKIFNTYNYSYGSISQALKTLKPQASQNSSIFKNLFSGSFKYFIIFNGFLIPQLLNFYKTHEILKNSYVVSQYSKMFNKSLKNFYF